MAKTVLEPFPEEEESSDDDPSAADEVLEKRMIERTAKTQPDGSLFSTIRDLADRVVFLVSRNVGGLKQLIDDAKKEDGGDKILLGVVIDEEKESVDQEHLLEIINRSAHDILNNDQGHPCLLQDPSSLGHHDPVALISKVDTDCLFAQAASKVFQDKGDGFQRDQFRERLLKAIDRLGQVDDDQEFLITQRTQRLSNRFSKRDESVTLIDFLSNLFEVKMQLLKTLVKPSPPITSRTTTTTTTATTTTITTTATTTTTTQGPVRIAEEQATTTTTTTTRTTTTTTTATTTTTTTTQGPVRTAEEQALVDLFGHDPFEAFNEDPEDPASLIYFDPSDATFVLNSATSFSPASSSDEVFEIQIHVADEQEMHEVETIVTFDPSDSTLELHKSPEHKVSFTGEESGKASDDPVSSEVNAEEVMIIFDPGHGNLDLTGNSQTPETIQELAGSHFPRDLEGAIEGTLEEESKKATSQDPGAVLFPDDDKKPTTKKYCKIDYSEKLCIEVDDNSIGKSFICLIGGAWCRFADNCHLLQFHVPRGPQPLSAPTCSCNPPSLTPGCPWGRPLPPGLGSADPPALQPPGLRQQKPLGLCHPRDVNALAPWRCLLSLVSSSVKHAPKPYPGESPNKLTRPATKLPPKSDKLHLFSSPYCMGFFRYMMYGP